MADETIAGRYRLVEPLGRGSMSSVWAADDLELERRVAVKMLTPAAERRRFEREARAAASLQHANIVGLYDYGEADGRPYMVLECLTGGSLEDRLSDGRPLPDDEARRIALDVSAGLAHAHERGLVHRDLKPANILFDSEGRAKIADFGIARMRGTGTLTEAGTVLGTAAYISPEQATGETATPASDVYSFGVILFRLLTGRLPFVSSNAMELVRMHRDEPPPSPHDVRADAPAGPASLAAAALAKDPAARPADGAALLAALRGEEPPAPPLADDLAATQVTRVVPASRPPRGSRRAVAVAAIVAVALLLGGAALALVLTDNGGGGADTTVPSLSLPTVSTEGSTSTAPITTEEQPTTTAETTTAEPTTTAAPTTTEPPPTTTAPATTVLPPPTTTPTTTEELPTTTIDTIPTTTAVETATTVP